MYYKKLISERQQIGTVLFFFFKEAIMNHSEFSCRRMQVLILEELQRNNFMNHLKSKHRALHT